MRPQYLALLTLLAMGASAPASAQIAFSANTVSPATPDTVVARLMSFDQNADGKIVARELPERMRGLLARGDSSRDGALDRVELRQLAAAPAPQLQFQNGLQPGRYAFGDSSGFDTSRHIEGALDDLRLAGDVRRKASEVARTFLGGADDRALKTLLATLEQLLSQEQLQDFRAAMSGTTVNVPAFRGPDGVTFFGARPDDTAGLERVMVPMRTRSLDLASYIERFELAPRPKQQAVEAIRQFTSRNPSRLSDTERLALVEQFRGLLTDEQRDDLRAALERRPLVQVSGGPTNTLDFLINRPAGVFVSPPPLQNEQNLRFTVGQTF
jgi:hypothetical protein